MYSLIDFVKSGVISPLISKPINELLSVTIIVKKIGKKDTVSFLHLAALYDFLDFFIYLINNHGSVTQESSSSLNPIDYACFGDSIEVLSYIIAKFPNILQTKDSYFINAVSCGSINCCKLLLDKGVKLDNSLQKGSNSPVAVATRLGNAQLVHLILTHEAKTMNASVLAISIIHSQWHAFRILLNNYPSSELNNRDTSRNLIFYACQNPDTPLDIFKIICDTLGTLDPPNDGAAYSESAIHWICQTENPQIVELALNYTIDINRMTNDGKTGPMYFIKQNEENNITILEMLVNHGFDINQRMDLYPSLLEFFAFGLKKKFLITKWLLQHGADINAPFIGSSHTLNHSTTIGQKIMSIPRYQTKIKEWGMEKLFEPIKIK